MAWGNGVCDRALRSFDVDGLWQLEEHTDHGGSVLGERLSVRFKITRTGATEVPAQPEKTCATSVCPERTTHVAAIQLKVSKAEKGQ